MSQKSVHNLAMRPNRIVLAGLLGLILAGLLGCKGEQGAGPSAQGTDESKVIGKWVVIADTAGQGHTGTLDLNADGTFSGEYNTGTSSDTMTGSYAVTRDDGVIIVTFTPLKFNGKDPTSPGQLRLMYDPQANIMHDMLTVAYARPGEEAQAAKHLERPTTQSSAINGPVVALNLLWRADILGRDTGAYSVTVGNIEGDRDDEILVTCFDGIRIFNTNGKEIRRVTLQSNPGWILALGKLEGKPIFVQFETWGDDVTAYAMDGKRLWGFASGGSGIDWLSALRFDANNTGYAIGYNGGGGVELLGPNGKSRWLAKADWNAWCVTGLSTGPTSPEQVVSVGPQDAVMFDGAGKQTKTFATGDIGAVGSVDLDGDGVEELLTLGTTVSSGQMLTVFDASGKMLWSQKANASNSASLEGEAFLLGTFGKRGRLLGITDAGGISFFTPIGTVHGIAKFNKAADSAAIAHRSGASDLIVLRMVNEVRCYEVSPE